MNYRGFVASACAMATLVMPNAILAEDGGSVPQNEFKTLSATFNKSVNGQPGTMTFQVIRNAGSDRKIAEFRVAYFAYSVDTKPAFYGDVLVKCADQPAHQVCTSQTFKVEATAGQLCNTAYPQGAGMQFSCTDKLSSTVQVTTVITMKDDMGKSRTQAEFVDLAS